MIFKIALLMLTVGFAKVEIPKTHSHGQAQLILNLEGKKLSSLLRIPQADLMGYEGNDDLENNKKALQTVTSLLESSSYELFIMNEDASCKVLKRKLTKEPLTDKKNHVDYTYALEFLCKDLSKVTELDVNLFRDLETLKSLNVYVNDKKPETLTPTESKIYLK